MAEAGAYPSLGGYDDEFVNEVEHELQCAICHLPLKEPILTKCGHRFCKQCLDEHFTRLEWDVKPLLCPVDRENLNRDRDIFRDKATERKILSFIIKCPSEGCAWTGELRSKESHLESCPLKVVSCSNEHCQVTLARKFLQEHVTTTCEWRILRCSHCSASHPSCQTKAHENECKRFPLNCPQSCGAVMAREEISVHIEKDCPLTMISCPYSQMGCTTKVQRRDVESHLQSTVRLHLDLACVKLNNTQEELKQTTRKHEEKFSVCQNEFKEVTRKLEEKIDVLENKLTRYLEEQNYTWKITGFSEVLRQAKTEANSTIASAPFYRHGYRLRLFLYPNGFGAGQNSYLSIYSQVMKGENDAILSWPFFKKVTFTLVDQQEVPNERQNIVRSSTTDRDEQVFARPVKNDNRAKGFHDFVPHNKLSERRYIVDDTLFLQVHYATVQ